MVQIAVLGMAVEESAHLPSGRLVRTVGGSSVNVAIGLRLWGLAPTLVVGGSAAALSRLRKSGLFGSGLIPVVGPPVKSTVEVGPQGSSTVAFATAAMPPFDRVPPADLVIFSGFDLLAAPALFSTTMDRLRQAGSRLWLDAGPAARHPSLLGPCLPALDALFLNLEEASSFTGLSQPGRMLRRIPVPEVHIKLGALGSIARRQALTLRAAPHPAQAVDSTGAGDFYLAAAAATRHLPLSATLAAANRLGALATEVQGAGLQLAVLAPSASTVRGSSRADD